ncbi:MAG: hypothetical protein K1X74_04690 [Pirellulales bacterium]|nr:hypothetical protein [Pirellulales bacterium]
MNLSEVVPVKATVLLLLGVLLLGQFVEPARAEGGGWWPFGATEEEVPDTSGDDIPDAAPESAPKTPAPKRPAAKKQPSLFARMGTSTRNFFTRTGNALSFSKKETSTSRYPRWTPETHTKKTTKKAHKSSKQESQGSWFSSMFGQEEPEPQQPQTLKDWIGQPRPGDETF